MTPRNTCNSIFNIFNYQSHQFLFSLQVLYPKKYKEAENKPSEKENDQVEESNYESEFESESSDYSSSNEQYEDTVVPTEISAQSNQKNKSRFETNILINSSSVILFFISPNPSIFVSKMCVGQGIIKQFARFLPNGTLLFRTVRLLKFRFFEFESGKNLVTQKH